jgi:hypothetical protein
MKAMMTVLPDAHYEVKSFATDPARNNVAAYGVFHGTHAGPGGPVPPPGRGTSTGGGYANRETALMFPRCFSAIRPLSAFMNAAVFLAMSLR